MTKKETIEAALDRYDDHGTLGQEMIAMIAVAARASVNDGKVNDFIREFSETLGFKKHFDTACHVMEYLYPKNPGYWAIQDRRYNKVLKNSTLLLANRLQNA